MRLRRVISRIGLWLTNGQTIAKPHPLLILGEICPGRLCREGTVKFRSIRKIKTWPIATERKLANLNYSPAAEASQVILLPRWIGFHSRFTSVGNSEWAFIRDDRKVRLPRGFGGGSEIFLRMCGRK